MPTYDYFCEACHHSFEQFQKINDVPLKICPQCGESIRRGPGGGIGLSFKGTGFYITDYKEGNKEPTTSCCPCGKNNSNCSSND